MPTTSAIEHPYIAGTDDADTLVLHIGQTVTLTILMHPAGKASLTSGLLPRKALALARDWVGPGLAAIAPSLRTGPVLVETDLDTEGQVRLPEGVGVRQGPELPLARHARHLAHRRDPRRDADRAAARRAGRAARRLDSRRAAEAGAGGRHERAAAPRRPSAQRGGVQ